MDKEALQNNRHDNLVRMMCQAFEVTPDDLLMFTLDETCRIQWYNTAVSNTLQYAPTALLQIKLEAILYGAEGTPWASIIAGIREHPECYLPAHLILRMANPQFVLSFFCVFITYPKGAHEAPPEEFMIRIVALKENYRDRDFEEEIWEKVTEFKKELAKNNLFHPITGRLTAEEKLLLARACEILHETNPPPSIPQLATASGLSETKLKNLFKKGTGKTVHRYVVDMIIARVKEMLKDPSLSITNIAEALNYSLPYFIRMFKRETGLTPQTYRFLGAETDHRRKNNSQH